MNIYFKRVLITKLITFFTSALIIFIIPFNFDLIFKFTLILLSFFMCTINLEEKYEINKLRFQCDIDTKKSKDEQLEFYNTNVHSINAKYRCQKSIAIIEVISTLCFVFYYLFVFFTDSLSIFDKLIFYVQVFSISYSITNFLQQLMNNLCKENYQLNLI